MDIKKILVGVDFGPATEAVLSYAAHFALATDASLTLLYAIDYLTTPPAYLAPYMEKEKKGALDNFTVLQKQLAERGIRTETEVTAGRLQESFESAIKKTQPDMLVLGFVSHTFRRSSSEKLIKGLKMPMLVVRGEKARTASSGPVIIKKILCPVDLSEQSQKALIVAKELQRTLSCSLEILSVMPYHKIRGLTSQDESDRLIRELHDDTKNRLENFLGNTGIEESVIIDDGEPGERIPAVAQKLDIDLIVIGARGLGLIKGMLIGSVTDAVLKTSPCPVLVIH
ncbi:MAG: universal stress protein [Thermodesulfovibrionales bacterium]|nr:universal stress protein [Thermodesulfovibrionales bacterium]